MNPGELEWVTEHHCINYPIITCEAIGASLQRISPFGWQWEVIVYEPFVSGPYPGTPDWHEYHLGSGWEITLPESKWKAFRCYERRTLMEDIWEEAQEMAMEAMEREEMLA